jgi:hypothetical protein
LEERSFLLREGCEELLQDWHKTRDLPWLKSAHDAYAELLRVRRKTPRVTILSTLTKWHRDGFVATSIGCVGNPPLDVPRSASYNWRVQLFLSASVIGPNNDPA